MRWRTRYACHSTPHAGEPPRPAGLRPRGSFSSDSSRVSLFCSRPKVSLPPLVQLGSLGEPTRTTVVADHTMTRLHNYLEVRDARRRLSCAARPPVTASHARQNATAHRFSSAPASCLESARLDRQ